MEKKKKKDAHAPLRLIQVEIARAEGRRGGERRLRETVFRTHLVCAQIALVLGSEYKYQDMQRE